MRVTIVPYVTGRPGDPYMGTPTGDRLERDLRGEMQRGDGLIHDFVAMPMDEAARAVGRRVLDLMGCSCVARPEAVRP